MDNIIDFCKKHEKIYLYGAGYFGKILRLLLEKKEITPCAFFTTNNPEMKEVLGVPVEKFDAAKIDEECGIVVSVGKNFCKEVAAFLETHNIKDYVCIDEASLISAEKSLQYNEDYPVNKNILVLLYHRIFHLQRDIRGMAVTPEHFEAHVKYLKERYPILRFEDDWSKVNQKSIVLTFDDGYDGFFEYAVPILEKHEVPAMLFVSSGILGGKQGLWTDRLEQMIFASDKEAFCYGKSSYDINDFAAKSDSFFRVRALLKKMPYENREAELHMIEQALEVQAKNDDAYAFLTKDRLCQASKSPFVSIGGHTVTHTPLSSESPERQRFEIETGKKELEEIIGQPVTCFSYPYGGTDDYTEETVAIAKDSGYKKVAAAIPGIASGSTPFGHIPRCGINDCNSDVFVRQIRKFWTLYGNG